MDSSRAILAIQRLIESGVVGGFRPYSSRLDVPDTSWTTTGILKSQHEGDGRIVLEALSHTSVDGVVVRVYQENPLVIHYAKRASSRGQIDAITREAAAVFESLPGHLEEETVEDLEGLGLHIGDLLNPIPPPFRIEDTPDAEQGVAPDA